MHFGRDGGAYPPPPPSDQRAILDEWQVPHQEYKQRRVAAQKGNCAVCYTSFSQVCGNCDQVPPNEVPLLIKRGGEHANTKTESEEALWSVSKREARFRKQVRLELLRSYVRQGGFFLELTKN